jgi:hypothetical protein
MKYDLYIAGPMSGYPDFNRTKFNEVAKKYRQMGIRVFNPAEHDNPALESTEPWDYYMRRDIPELCQCSKMMLLNGWQESEGAKLELTIAKALGIHVYDEQEKRLFETTKSHVIPSEHVKSSEAQAEHVEQPEPTKEIGIKYDTEKPDWSLMPLESLNSVIRVMMFGAKKYNRDNWKKVCPAERYFSAALRHLTSHQSGDIFDSETGETHLSHALCSLLFYKAIKDKELDTEE